MKLQPDRKMLVVVSFALTTLALFSVVAVRSASRPSTGELAVEYRQSLYTVMSANFRPLGAMAEGVMPFNAAEAQKRADRIAFLAPMFKEAFPADSNGVARTAARSEIWAAAAEFDKNQQAFIDKTALLAAAARTSDFAKVKYAIQETGETCKSCHYKFKETR